jgi:hypothetical protein
LEEKGLYVRLSSQCLLNPYCLNSRTSILRNLSNEDDLHGIFLVSRDINARQIWLVAKIALLAGMGLKQKI